MVNEIFSKISRSLKILRPWLQFILRLRYFHNYSKITSWLHAFRHVINIDERKKKELLKFTSFSFQTVIPLLISLTPNSHFVCIWQMYLPFLMFGRKYSVLLSNELLFFQSIFRETVWHFSSFSCLYDKMNNDSSPEKHFHSRIRLSFSNDAWRKKNE